MGNNLRCCLACVLPCGALDLIRIVHISGHVEEISHPITAGEILKANPKHVLSTPCEGSRKILILSPQSELKRGHIYFLIPSNSKNINHTKKSSSNNIIIRPAEPDNEKPKSSKKVRRSQVIGAAAVWRPDLRSISEEY